jgi:oligopeptide/dipeptide ABC transporter ATP-binding protein
MTAVLEIQDLTLEFATQSGKVHALDKVSLSVGRGECLALVGESGSGKSITGMSVMRLNGESAEVSASRMTLGATSLTSLDEKSFRKIRGKRIAMIFQNAKSSLNPLRQVGDTLIDILRAHSKEKIRHHEAEQHVLALLKAIGIDQAEQRMAAYPAELSGGMCQRIMIAAALVCEPELIIADEPTSALDVTTQIKVMDLLMAACRERGVAVIFITHDLALASAYCDRVAVMHAGQVLEIGPSGSVFGHPAHPYTRMLLDAMPYGKETVADLQPMGGNLPDLRRDNLPSCRFFERCPRAADLCRVSSLPDTLEDESHIVRCHFPNER